LEPPAAALALRLTGMAVCLLDAMMVAALLESLAAFTSNYLPELEEKNGTVRELVPEIDFRTNSLPGIDFRKSHGALKWHVS
jgi:hypothetical protein